MSDHDTLSPSSRHRYKHCPGSVREGKKYPEKPSGPAAADGTHTHTLLETCIVAGMVPAITYVGQTLKDHDGEFVVDAERAERVQFALDYIKSRLEIFNGECKLYAERKVNPEHLLGRKDMKGTVDVTIISESHRTIEIIDLKDGMTPVDAVDNEQLEVYAMAVLSELGLPVNVTYPYDVVTMTIIQPKMRIKKMPPISSHTLSVRQVLDMIGPMVSEAHLTEQPDAKLIPGDKQCKYCNAAGNCVAQTQQALNGIGIMFQPINNEVPAFLAGPVAAVPELPSFLAAPTTAATVVQPAAEVIDLSHQAANKDPATMTDEQLARALEAAPLIRQVLANAEEEALRRMKLGSTIPGFKVVNGRGSRSWALPEDEMAAKLIGMGIPKSAVYETKLVSPAQAEKLVWEKTSKGEVVKKSLTERQLKTLDTEYIAKIGGKLTIVPEADSRPAVTLNAAPLFAAIEPQPAPAPVAELPDWMK